MSFVLEERGVIDSPWGVPLERKGAEVGAVAKAPLLGCQIFHFCISCSRPEQPYNNDNNNDWEDGIVVSASEGVRLHQLAIYPWVGDGFISSISTYL